MGTFLQTTNITEIYKIRLKLYDSILKNFEKGYNLSKLNYCVDLKLSNTFSYQMLNMYGREANLNSFETMIFLH